MKAFLVSRTRSRRRGIMLVECLVYFGVSIVLVGLGIALYLRCLDSATNLERNADDIAGSLQLGERWRADLRLAIAEPRISSDTNGDFVIPLANGSVTYRFSQGAFWRQRSDEAGWTRLLDRVVSANWSDEVRTHVTAWRLDLELRTRKHDARIRPLFSFIGVAGHPAIP